MARSIHCTVVKVPPVNDPFAAEDEFQDLMPWADPYITALVDKLRRTAVLEDAFRDDREMDDRASLRREHTERRPHLESRSHQERFRRLDWSPRSWPHRQG